MKDQIKEDMTIALGAALYILLSSIDPSYHGGKRGRKAILKDIKRHLAIFSKKDVDRYLLLVEFGDESIHAARDSVGYSDSTDYRTNPGIIIKFLSWRYPKLMSSFNLKKDHIENLNDHYMGTEFGFYSIRYANRLVDAISKVNIKSSSCWQKELMDSIYTKRNTIKMPTPKPPSYMVGF